MTAKPHPFYWETLIKLDAPKLEAALLEGARQNLDWAVDQARILVLQASRQQGTMRVLGKFADAVKDSLQDCEAHIVRNVFEIAARCDADTRAKTVADYKAWLDGLGQMAKPRALAQATDTALSLVAPRTMREAALDFILDNATLANSQSFKTVCACASQKQVGAIIKKLEVLGQKAPFAAMQALGTLLEFEKHATGIQRYEAAILRDKLEADPRAQSDALASMGIMVILPDNGIIGSASPRLQ
ncbi:MAG: hypothetical protein KGQ41_07985 [Alphaproteobacteria bacterium]|nr:hypothetical protein [Alphaproteobacteria bacterium]